MEREGRENHGFISNQNGEFIQHEVTGVKVLNKSLEQLTTDIKKFSKAQDVKMDMLCEKLDRFELTMIKMHEDSKGGKSGSFRTSSVHFQFGTWTQEKLVKETMPEAMDAIVLLKLDVT